MYIIAMRDVEWDELKARANWRKHGGILPDAVSVLEDDLALTVEDDEVAHEERFVTVGDPFGRVLVVVYTWRGDRIRLISARALPPASGRPTTFSDEEGLRLPRGSAGLVVPVPRGKTRITIRFDDDVIAWFREQVHAAGGGNYQTLINLALREYIADQKESLEKTLRRVLREELAHR